MMRLFTVTACMLAFALVSSFSDAQDASAKAAIDAGNKHFVAAFDKRDAAGIAALYGEDAEAYPPNSDVVRGRPAIQKMWQSTFDSGIAGASLATTQVESGGNIAYESGKYEMKTKDGKVADNGKYVVVWKRTGGKWLIHRDIWNTNQPAK